MRSRQSPEHREAVARRLELLRADLAGERGPDAPDDEPPWWSGHTRVPELRVVEPLPGDEPPVPAVGVGAVGVGAVGVPAVAAGAVPQPGRHAARRAPGGAVAAVAALLPETVRGRALIGPWQVAVVALVLAAGLAVTCWWVVRSDPAPVTVSESTAPLVDLSPAPSATSPPLTAATGSAGAATPGGAAGASPAGASGQVVVDVTGKVRHRGVFTLPAGSRVVDALRAAGGARPGVDLSGLNLARVLVDGEQVAVGVAAVPDPAPGSGAGAGPGGAAGAVPLVNLNTATLEQLETLPQVGPVTAQAIIDWRTAHGGFSAVEELLEVDGIGEATLEKLTPHVTV